MNILEWLAAVSALALVGVAVLWTTGAIYFDVARTRWYAWPLILLTATCCGAMFVFWRPVWQPLFAVLAAVLLFLRWWFSQQPSNHRDWDPNYAVLPKFVIDGDAVQVQNVRNTVYRTAEDFTPQFETRDYCLSQLNGVDGIIVYWGSPFLCHPMLVFDFGKQGRLCMSIEVRYRRHQDYNFWRSLYRQQEIIYVASDERDAILKRSKYLDDHDVYLYRLQVDPEEVRKVFLEYVVSANALHDQPRWYHGITTNCTTSIYRQRSRKIDWDWRWLFNGKLDEMIYDHDRLDRSVPFAELKQKSEITQLANEAPAEGFGDYVRSRLPLYRAALHGV